MKHLLLFIFLFTSVFSASAQYEYLAITGVAAGINALKGHPQKPTEFVTEASYQGRTFAQKRTPANKLPGKGGAQIMAIEQLLASDYAALQASTTAPVLGTDGEAKFTAALNQLTAARPNWSTTAYSEELSFYRQEDNHRQAARKELERKQAYQQQERERAQRDSLERLSLRRTHLIDSTRTAVLAEMRAQADSAAQVQAAVRKAAQTSAPSPATSTQAYTAATPRATVAHKPAVRKVVVKVKRSTGPMVYYCASGNTVKYHASPNCRGLTRCGASILPMSLNEAQQSMDPCKWCY